MTKIFMFEPGKVIKEFETRSGKLITIRYPKEDDVEGLVEYINAISVEDTFTETNGHVFTMDEEKQWLTDLIKKMDQGNAVHLLCEFEGKIVGASHVFRKNPRYHRFDHVGVFGIALAQGFRGDGIGKMLMGTAIAEAKEKLAGLKMMEISCFGCNTGGLALYGKFGFKECGRLPKSVLHRGVYVDNVNMYLDLEEF